MKRRGFTLWCLLHKPVELRCRCLVKTGLFFETEKPDLWGGWAKLSNGWVFEMPAFDEPPSMPCTVDARRLTTAEED